MKTIQHWQNEYIQVIDKLNSVIVNIEKNVQIHKTLTDIVDIIKSQQEYYDLMDQLIVARGEWIRVNRDVWLREETPEHMAKVLRFKQIREIVEREA